MATQSAVKIYREIIKENIEYDHFLRHSKIDRSNWMASWNCCWKLSISVLLSVLPVSFSGYFDSFKTDSRTCSGSAPLLYINCHRLIEQLKKVHFENRLPDKLKVLAKYRMLIIDEIGYLPMDIQGGTRQLPFSQGVLKFANQTYHALYLFILFMHHEMQKEDTGGFDDV